MIWLLNGDVLIVVSLTDHPHHGQVRRSRAVTPGDTIATCPLTEGALLRLHMQHGVLWPESTFLIPV